MQIEFNKVTWYSKLVAVVLGLAIFGVAFYLGSLYAQVKSLEVTEVIPETPKSISEQTKKVTETIPDSLDIRLKNPLFYPSVPPDLSMLGKPCTQQDAGIKGLQCYFYGDLDDSKVTRDSMWIVPDFPEVRSFQLVEADRKIYKDATDSWKKYSSPDGSVSFKIPPGASVFPQQNDTYQVTYPGGGTTYSVSKLVGSQHSMVNIDDSIKSYIDEVKYHPVARKEALTFDEDDNAVAVTYAPNTNLQSYMYDLYVTKGGNAYIVTVELYGDDSDFIANAFLTTVTLK